MRSGRASKAAYRSFMQGDPAGLAILGVAEGNVPALKVDIRPIKPMRLSSESAGIREKRNKRPQMGAARTHQAIRFLKSEPPGLSANRLVNQ